MKRAVLAIAALSFLLLEGAAVCSAQGVFKVPFPFQAGDKKFPPGEYRIARQGNEQIILRKEPNGADAAVAALKPLPQPNPPFTEPQLVFDAVGNFEPSYTEYVTDYVLAEVWLAGQDGLLIHMTKGAHSHQTIKGTGAGPR